jgi:hypothetical protein
MVVTLIEPKEHVFILSTDGIEDHSRFSVLNETQRTIWLKIANFKVEGQTKPPEFSDSKSVEPGAQSVHFIHVNQLVQSQCNCNEKTIASKTFRGSFGLIIYACKPGDFPQQPLACLTNHFQLLLPVGSPKDPTVIFRVI